ncbi:hypothetical protein DL98DRAFT_592643 [Cadophora sp. DSE1049]|nr:hypothetical protein DL98DRAFT_592643 [Cadophora sp. DSE1049]
MKSYTSPMMAGPSIIFPCAVSLVVQSLVHYCSKGNRNAALAVFCLQLWFELLFLLLGDGVEFRGTDRKYARDQAMAAVRRAIRAQPAGFTKELEKEWFLRAVEKIDASQQWTLRERMRDSLVVMWVVSLYERMELVAVTNYCRVTESLAWSLAKKVCRWGVGEMAAIKAVIERESREVRNRNCESELERKLREEVQAYGIKVAPPRPENKNTSGTLGESARALLAMQHAQSDTDSQNKNTLVEAASSQVTNPLSPEEIYRITYSEAKKQKLEIDTRKVLNYAFSTTREQPDSTSPAALLVEYLSFKPEPDYLSSELETAGVDPMVAATEMCRLNKLAFAALSKEVSAIRAEREEGEKKEEEEWEEEEGNAEKEKNKKGEEVMDKSSKEQFPGERAECGVEMTETARIWGELVKELEERRGLILGDEGREEMEDGGEEEDEEDEEDAEDQWDDCSELMED